MAKLVSALTVNQEQYGGVAMDDPFKTDTYQFLQSNGDKGDQFR